MLGFSPAFTRSGICPKHYVASMYQRTGCEDRGGGSQGVGGNEWAAGWKGRMRWRGRACRSRGGGRESWACWEQEQRSGIMRTCSPWAWKLSLVSLLLSCQWTSVNNCWTCVFIVSFSLLCHFAGSDPALLWTSAGERCAVAAGRSCSSSQPGVTLIPPPSQQKKEGGLFPGLHHKRNS